jgi:hypothetical protein
MLFFSISSFGIALIGDLVYIAFFFFRVSAISKNILTLGWFSILQKNNLVLLFVKA